MPFIIEVLPEMLILAFCLQHDEEVENQPTRLYRQILGREQCQL